MAPRRSTARASSATPIRANSPSKRSTRASSILSPEDAVPRRTTRGASQQPNLADGGVNNPKLPEVQIQQSYAYGSSKTPVLPAQLVARNKMNLREMAETLDAGVEQAQQNLQTHNQESQANLRKETRADRARRRASREDSREPSVASDDVEQNKAQRVAAWAGSLDSSQLDQIPEEERDAARDTPDDASRKDTDPSSFPSGIFDHSYNYERGLRKPNVTVRRREESVVQKTVQKTTAATKEAVQKSRQLSSHLFHSTLDWCRRLSQTSGRAINDFPNSRLVTTVTSLLFVSLIIAAASLLVCYTYTNHICDPFTTSPVGLTMQKYCGSCVRNPSTPLNITTGNYGDMSKLSAALNTLNSQIRAIELRLSDKLEQNHAAVDKDIETLRKQQAELSNYLSSVEFGRTGSSGDVASPVIAKINFFAPNNGALVEERLTSPTRQRSLGFWQRVALRMVLSTYYQTKQPVTALMPWQDVGDCWCSSPVPFEQDTMRLGVRVSEMIFPTELVVENYPTAGSLFPGSTPKHIEVWADFEHLDGQEWESLNIRQMQGNSPIGPHWALIGQSDYDASVEATHVQAFRLDVNQQQHLYAAENFIIRVVSNYGSDYTCLYRVRMHGVPMRGQ
ncbi:hypothetical protein EDD37DRAFT_416341 [Exophiala viscosa]|uniref:uncharacterized protein n=1 Tax=Exophiala viscosa TaxID=2486360 RepID=UPI00219173EC|nr:hypothetical protein EDD37DRAFT_416341 [Exophiala viscosa]